MGGGLQGPGGPWEEGSCECDNHPQERPGWLRSGGTVNTEGMGLGELLELAVNQSPVAVMVVGMVANIQILGVTMRFLWGVH